MHAISLAKYRARKKAVVQPNIPPSGFSRGGELVDFVGSRRKQPSPNFDLVVIEVPALACRTERGYGVAMATALGGEILYFPSQRDFEFARRDALFNGKSITVYARERTTIGDYPAAVRQLKSEAI
ncbi:MAG: hypothetical protein KTR25_00255 [Myxococcales bacterium]|nr:hypothetical protein [Myxococcales bacterium]